MQVHIVQLFGDSFSACAHGFFFPQSRWASHAFLWGTQIIFWSTLRRFVSWLSLLVQLDQECVPSSCLVHV